MTYNNVMESAAYAATGLILLFLAWAFVGKRADRNQPLRYSLVCVILLAAIIAYFIVEVYFVIFPDVIFSKHEFQPPYEFWRKFLSIFNMLSIVAFAGIVMFLTSVAVARKKRNLLLFLALICIGAATFAVEWYLIYRIQVHALEHFIRVESKEWKTHVGGTAPDVQVSLLDGTAMNLADLRGKVVVVISSRLGVDRV